MTNSFVRGGLIQYPITRRRRTVTEAMKLRCLSSKAPFRSVTVPRYSMADQILYSFSDAGKISRRIGIQRNRE